MSGVTKFLLKNNVHDFCFSVKNCVVQYESQSENVIVERSHNLMSLVMTKMLTVLLVELSLILC